MKNANIEVIHVYNCSTHKAVELKAREADYWADLIICGSDGNHIPAENMTYKYPGVKNLYKATLKEPGTGNMFNVYFQDSVVEKQLDAKRATMF